MIMFTEKQIVGSLELDEKEKNSIIDTITILSTLDDLANENDCTLLDFITKSYEDNFFDFLEDLHSNPQKTFESFLDTVNQE